MGEPPSTSSLLVSPRFRFFSLSDGDGLRGASPEAHHVHVLVDNPGLVAVAGFAAVMPAQNPGCPRTVPVLHQHWTGRYYPSFRRKTESTRVVWTRFPSGLVSV
jgi:hypothetical protein